MTSIQQQMTAVTATQMQAQLVWYRDMSQTAFESMERLLQLNFAATRASLQDTADAARQVLHATGPGEMMAVLRAQSGPHIGKSIAYGNHLFHIASDTHADLSRCAESRIAEAGEYASALIDVTARTVPPGTRSLLVLVKTAVDQASGGYARLNRSSRQAVETLESNVDAAVNQIVHPVAPPDLPTTPTVSS